jgi:hypothetical protein
MTTTNAARTTAAQRPSDEPTAAEMVEFLTLLSQVRPSDLAGLLARMAATVQRHRLH